MVSNEGSEETGEELRLPTTAALEKVLQILEFNSPLNLTPITNFIRQEVVSRISFFENKISKIWIFKMFVQLGIPQVYLFAAIIIFSGMMVRSMYKKSVYLLCNLVGVVYPAYKSIQAIDLSTNDNEKGEVSTTIAFKEQKQWLTYWVVYGWLQVADNWSNWLLETFPGYNLFKLIFLYWAQNGRSRGATLIFEKLLRPLLKKPLINNIHNTASTSQKQRQKQQTIQQPIISRRVVEGTPSSSVSFRPEPPPEEIWKMETVATSRDNDVKPYRLSSVS
ncbi:8059_t:CDS:1 [Funneliformis geosporum]|uniref:Protein YOP1 n=1 Tax=Funneliformis geosporum TaxID=1117311 RepID=A0A9W4WJT4_9GLOM|nr:6048_t:CDS:1 [Funneliformis geosporum]CAI2176123.1 8059_t:CDS:1 [Funneliformis geosporum]